MKNSSLSATHPPLPKLEKPPDTTEVMMMSRPTLFFADAPEITDQAANDILEFLFEFTTAFENKYYAQLIRYDQEQEVHREEQRALHLEQHCLKTAEIDDELPDF
jgi:hypothetical protein